MSNFLDLEDYKLQTEFDRLHGVVLHRSYRADWANGRRRVVVEERWVPQRKVLGVGTFGTVRLETRQGETGGRGGSRANDPKYRAVKQLRKMDMSRMNVDVRKELLALTKFSRSKFFDTQAFVNFLGWFEDEDNVYIAMEYFQHGTLDEFITQKLSEKDAQIIALQLLEGLKIMHDEHFTHRDLKPQNIFVVQHSPNWWVKIGDFGISKRVANNETALQTNVGTPLYLAPEVFHYVPLPDEESDTYTNAVDVWSLACVVYTMLALRPPFVEWPRKLLIYCNGGDFPEGPLQGRASSLAVDFIKSVLVPFPSERPTAKAALNSSWFQDESLYESQSPIMQTKFDNFESSYAYSSAPAESGGHPPVSRMSEDQSWDSETLAGSDGFRTVINAQASAIMHSASVSDNLTAYRSGVSMQLADRTKADQGSVEGRMSDAFRCINCTDTINGEYYHCSLCNMSLCPICLGYGNHCLHEDHWFVKRNRQNNDQITDNTTQTMATWVRWSADSATTKEHLTKEPASLSKWDRMPRKSHKGRYYDYCFQCRTTFPADEPPHRHLWEQHDTVDMPVTQTEGFARSRGTLPQPSAEMWLQKPTAEEQKLQNMKIKKMEEEMTVVFNQKVSEKEKTLRNSEEEMYRAYRGIKDDLLSKGRQIKERKENLEKNPPPPPPKKRLGFSLR